MTAQNITMHQKQEHHTPEQLRRQWLIEQGKCCLGELRAALYRQCYRLSIPDTHAVLNNIEATHQHLARLKSGTPSPLQAKTDFDCLIAMHRCACILKLEQLVAKITEITNA